MTRPSTFAVLAAAALLAWAPRPALAEEPAKTTEARAHFQRGVELYTERNYAAALVEFQRAHEVAPNYRLLFNIGQTCYELADYVCAVEAYKDYLQKGGGEIPEARVAEVNQSLQKLSARVARLAFKANVDGAEIRIDDRPVGTTPTASPTLVSAGRRRITASKQGLPPVTKVLDVAGGDAITVALDFEVSPPRADAPAPAPQPPPAREGGVPAGIWVGVGITSALAVGAGVTGIFAARAHADYEHLLGTYPVKKSDVDDAATRTQRLSITADVLLGSAVIAGGVTLIVALTRSKEAKPLPVSVSAGPGSLLLHGRF